MQQPIFGINPLHRQKQTHINPQNTQQTNTKGIVTNQPKQKNKFFQDNHTHTDQQMRLEQQTNHKKLKQQIEDDKLNQQKQADKLKQQTQDDKLKSTNMNSQKEKLLSQQIQKYSFDMRERNSQLRAKTENKIKVNKKRSKPQEINKWFGKVSLYRLRAERQTIENHIKSMASQINYTNKQVKKQQLRQKQQQIRQQQRQHFRNRMFEQNKKNHQIFLSHEAIINKRKLQLRQEVFQHKRIKHYKTEQSRKLIAQQGHHHRTTMSKFHEFIQAQQQQQQQRKRQQYLRQKHEYCVRHKKLLRQMQVRKQISKHRFKSKWVKEFQTLQQRKQVYEQKKELFSRKLKEVLQRGSIRTIDY